MANEVLKTDANNQRVIGLVTDDAAQEIRMGRIDDATKGLKVMIVGGSGAPVSGSGTAGQVTYWNGTSTLTGDTTFAYTIANGLRIGPVSASISTENKLSVIGNANDYHGTFIQNKNAGALASTDMVFTNDLGTLDLTTYADLGVNSSGNTNAAMTGFGANDIYLFTSGQLAGINIATGGNNPIDFMTNGYLTANKRMRIDGSGNIGIGTGVSALTATVTLQQDAIGATFNTTKGIFLQNTTAAAVGAQQVSPVFTFSSNGWATTGSTSQNTQFSIYNLPVQGTGSPSSNLIFASGINGVTAVARLTLTSTGTMISGAAASTTVSLQTNVTLINSDFATVSTGGALQNTALLGFGGSNAVQSRVFMRGSASLLPATGTVATGFVIGTQDISLPAGGNVLWGAQQVINPLTVTVGTGTISNTASLYINGASAAVVSGANYALYVAAGATSLNGAVLYGNNAVTVAANAATVPVTARLTTVTNNAAGAVTITITTTGATDGQLLMVRFYDFSAVAQTLTWVNTEDSTVTAPTTSNGSTTLPLTIGFMYNASTSKWRTIAKA